MGTSSPLLSLLFCKGKGMVVKGDGCVRTRAQSQGQEAERGFPCVEKLDPLF